MSVTCQRAGPWHHVQGRSYVISYVAQKPLFSLWGGVVLLYAHVRADIRQGHYSSESLAVYAKYLCGTTCAHANEHSIPLAIAFNLGNAVHSDTRMGRSAGKWLKDTLDLASRSHAFSATRLPREGVAPRW